MFSNFLNRNKKVEVEPVRPNHAGAYTPKPIAVVAKEQNPREPRFDPNSSVWQYVHTVIGKEIEALRVLNDKHLPVVETASIRGEIKRLKQMQQLPERIAKGIETHLKF